LQEDADEDAADRTRDNRRGEMSVGSGLFVGDTLDKHTRI